MWKKGCGCISCFALFFVFRVGRGGLSGVSDVEARFSGYHPLRLDCVQISRVSDSKSTEEQEKKRVSCISPRGRNHIVFMCLLCYLVRFFMSVGPQPCVCAWVWVIFTLLAHPFLCSNKIAALALLHMSHPNPPPPLLSNPRSGGAGAEVQVGELQRFH